MKKTKQKTTNDKSRKVSPAPRSFSHAKHSNSARSLPAIFCKHSLNAQPLHRSDPVSFSMLHLVKIATMVKLLAILVNLCKF